MSTTTTALVAKFDAFLRQLNPDDYTKIAAMPLRHALTLMPMREVLAQVPGTTIGDKAERVGVSRNTWYEWKAGKIRPSRQQAARLEQLTKIPAEKFQGRR